MNYQQLKDTGGNLRTDIIRRLNDDGSVSDIPNNSFNNDWIAYQAWLALGNTPLAAS